MRLDVLGPLSRNGREVVVGANRDWPDRANRAIATLGTIAAVWALSACEGSAASSSASTLQVAPPTTAEQAATSEQAATTVVSTTTVQSTTSLSPTTVALRTAPSSTTVEDGLEIAIERAQTAMRNCYAAAPGPCNQAELEKVLVGVQLDAIGRGAQAATENGYHAEQLDRLVWRTLGGPTLQGDDRAVATICRHDASLAVNADGSIVNDEDVYYRQTWHLLLVDSTWKLSEIIDVERVLASEGNPCE